MKNSIKFVRSFPEFGKVEVINQLRECTPREPVKGKDVILDTIFAVDPTTNLPKGDIAIYLSDKCNPQVREFIRLNLMAEHGNTPALPEENSDLLFDFIRGKDETVSDYARRMSQYFKKAEKVESKED